MIGNTRKKLKRINLPNFLLDIINNYDILSKNQIQDMIHNQVVTEKYDISLNLLCSLLSEITDVKYEKNVFLEKISLIYDLNEINLQRIKNIIENDKFFNNFKNADSMHQKYSIPKLEKKTVESNFPINGMIPQNTEKELNNMTFLKLKENDPISDNNLINFSYKPSKRESNSQRKNAIRTFQHLAEIDKNMLFYNLSTKSNSLGTNKNINSPIRKNSNVTLENNIEISKSEVGYNLVKNNLVLDGVKDEVEEKISLKTVADAILKEDFFDYKVKEYGAKSSGTYFNTYNKSKSKIKGQLYSKSKKNYYIVDKSLGLKEISSKVMQIVRKTNSTNYKEISDNIVNEIPNLTSQDSKNIRRRIYDSLNVLKALDVLIISDDNKSIVFNKTNCIFDYNDDLKMDIDKKNSDLKMKQLKYNDVIENIEIIKSLINRNKQDEETKHKSSEIISKIYCPFVVLCTENIECNDKIEVKLSEKGLNKVFLSSPSQIAIKGDQDIFKQVHQIMK